MGFDELLAKQKPRKNTRGRRSAESREPAVPRGANRRRVKERAAAEPSSRAGAARENRRKSLPNALREPSVPLVMDSPDPMLLAAMYALVGFGLVMVYSASAVYADRTLHDAHALIRSQLMHAVLAGSVAWVIGHYGDYRWLRRATYPMFALTLLMLAVTASEYGATAGGAKRWIAFGSLFRIQPAEIAKLVVICWLADSLTKKREQIHTFRIGFVPHLLGAGLFIWLCLKQPDFGSAVMILLLLFAMLFTAGARLGYLIGLGLCGLAVACVEVARSPYRLRRIGAYSPDAYQWLIDNFEWLAQKSGNLKAPDNYQLWESQLSFGAGGVWGVGLGNSHQKLMYLPEAHTDFISAIVAEELGLVGFSVMVLAYLYLVYRGIRTGLACPDMYGTYLCVGISLFIGMQAFTNLAVAVGVVPTKGLVLPFISFGGSSLLVNCCAVGLLSNVSRLQRAQSLVSSPPRTGRSGRADRVGAAARAAGGVS